jgi:hypothetical protein
LHSYYTVKDALVGGNSNIAAATIFANNINGVSEQKAEHHYCVVRVIVFDLALSGL